MILPVQVHSGLAKDTQMAAPIAFHFEWRDGIFTPFAALFTSGDKHE
jgi:hypothetical protein